MATRQKLCGKAQLQIETRVLRELHFYDPKIVASRATRRELKISLEDQLEIRESSRGGRGKDRT